jgi:hypothetical protein
MVAVRCPDTVEQDTADGERGVVVRDRQRDDAVLLGPPTQRRTRFGRR